MDESATPRPRRSTALAVLTLVPVVLLVLHTGLDILPDDPLFGVVTLSRLLLLVGFVAALASGARLVDLRTRLDWLVGALLLAALVTTWRTGFGAAQLRGLLEQVAFFYLAVVCIRRDEWSNGLPLAALLAVVAAAGVGVGQFMQDVPTTFYRDGLASVTSVEPRPDLVVRAIGTFSNPNLLAAYVVLLTPFALLVAVQSRELEHRTTVAVGAGVALTGLVVSWSRAGIVALLVATAVLAVTWWWASTSSRGYARAGVVALAVFTVSVLTAAVSGLLGRIANRDEAWELAVRVAVDNPLFGVGLGRAGDVMNAVGDPQLPYFHAHNLWLHWWVETGPVGAVAMFAVFAVSLWVGARRALAGSVFALAGLAGLAGFAVTAMVDHPANLGRIALAMWFVLAAIHAPVGRRPAGRAPRRGQRAATAPIDAGRDATLTVGRPVGRSPGPPAAARPPQADHRA